MTYPSSIRIVLDRLQGVRENEKGYMATDKEQLIEIIVAATRKGNNGIDVVDLGEVWPGDELGSFEPLANVLRDLGIKFDSEGNGQ